MRRRAFIAALGGAAAAWPLAARAQKSERVRRIGVLLPAAADDAEYQARVGAFLQGLAQLGWTDGRNARIDIRWATTSENILEALQQRGPWITSRLSEKDRTTIRTMRKLGVPLKVVAHRFGISLPYASEIANNRK